MTCTRRDKRENIGARFSKLLSTAMLSVVLGFGMLMAVPFASGGQKAFADGVENTPYTYTVTVYAGNGTIDGKDSASIGGLGYGADLSMSLDNANNENDATLTVNGHSFVVKAADERHYPKGIRLAGANEADMAVPFDSVTQNQQFVIAYGLTKDRVAYRVDYLDETGNALAESQTFYGNVGDKPVVAFQYIENYVPNAYNITGTLSANEADNVFQFVYKPVDPATYQILYINRGTVLNTGPEAAMRAAEETGSGGENANADGASPQEPAELIDLDDNETPLASGIGGNAVDSGQGASIFSSTMAFALFGLAVLLVILAVMLWKFARRDKHQS